MPFSKREIAKILKKGNPCVNNLVFVLLPPPLIYLFIIMIPSHHHHHLYYWLSSLLCCHCCCIKFFAPGVEEDYPTKTTTVRVGLLLHLTSNKNWADLNLMNIQTNQRPLVHI